MRPRTREFAWAGACACYKNDKQAGLDGAGDRSQTFGVAAVAAGAGAAAAASFAFPDGGRASRDANPPARGHGTRGAL